MRFPTGYGANLKKAFGSLESPKWPQYLKTHDYHRLLQDIIPVAIMGLGKIYIFMNIFLFIILNFSLNMIYSNIHNDFLIIQELMSYKMLFNLLEDCYDGFALRRLEQRRFHKWRILELKFYASQKEHYLRYFLTLRYKKLHIFQLYIIYYDG